MWTPEEDEQLRVMFLNITHEEISRLLGKTKNAVRNRCSRLKLRKRPSFWTDSEVEHLKSSYKSNEGFEFSLDDLAQELGRGRMSVALKASELGLGNYSRVKREGRKDRRKYKGDVDKMRAGLSESRKKYIAEHGHPKGFLGHKRPEEWKHFISVHIFFYNVRKTKQDVERSNQKRRETNMARYGTYAPVSKSSNAYSRSRGGKREDLGGMYFRSAWEANYARFLNYLKSLGEIREWQFEPDTFYFEGVKRGAYSYIPDFKIFENDGRIVYHEVKGWMDGKSKTKLSRMKKFHPEISVVVIGEAEYKAISKYSALIPNWE